MLPKLDLPSYSITLPSNKTTLRFRPFLTKEEKILQIAKESGDLHEIVYALKQVITNCCLSPIDVDKLAMVDLEYFFLRLRAKSIGEEVIAQYECQNEVDGKPCKNVVKILIDLEKIEVKFPEKDYSLIKITDKVSLKMQFPKFELLDKITEFQLHPDDYELGFEIISECVKCVVEGEKIYDEFTMDEMKLFLETLTVNKFSEVEDFLNNLPTVSKKLEFHCHKCGFKDEILLEGVESFFD